MFQGAGIFVAQQLFALALGYTIVKRLVVRQRPRGIKDMYRARHVGVHQANQLEVPGHREDNGQLLTFEEKRTSDAVGTVEGRGPVENPGQPTVKGGLI